MDQINIGKRFILKKEKKKACRRAMPQIFVGETSMEEGEVGGCWEPRGNGREKGKQELLHMCD